MKVIKRINSKVETIDRTVEYANVADNVAAYRVTNKIVITRKRGHNGKLRCEDLVRVDCGFGSVTGIKEFLAGRVEIIPEPEGPFSFSMVNSQYLEILKLQGWLSLPEDPERKRIFEGMAEIKDPLAHLERGLGSETIIKFAGANIVFDLNDKPLPVAMMIGDGMYMSLSLDYDEDMVHKILKERNDVSVYKAPYGKKVFVWNPSVKDYRLMWDRCKSLEGASIYSLGSLKKYHAIFDLDLLGLRAGGASKYDEFLGRLSEEDCYDY